MSRQVVRQCACRALGPRAFLLAPLALAMSGAQAAPLPGGTLDPLVIPKYVTPLVIPPVMNRAPGATTSDYDIAVRQFKQQILPGGHWNAVSADCAANTALCTLPATTVWSYGPADDPLPDSSGIPGGSVGLAPAPNSQFNYPAYTIENTSFVQTTVDWINQLVKDPVACKTSTTPTTDPACNYIPHLLPVDRSLHWANPEQLPCIEQGKTKDCAPDAAKLTDPTILKRPYDGPVPMVVHVHGAHATPESDGYAEAWWLPNANNIPAGYATTGTFVNQFGVATNNPARPGVGTFTYPNSQPSSTVWYHDHALGMTRSNVYAGPAGFWILRDPAAPSKETGLVSGTLPGPAPVAGDAVLDLNIPGSTKRAAVREIPIAIQDRSFNSDGSLFYPDNRAFFEGLVPADLQIPFIGDPTPSDIAAIWNPEAFFNTMVVNGVSWPTLEVEPDLHRFRLLNGCNARFLNLALYVVNADGTLGAELPFYQIGAEQSLLPKVVKIVRGNRAVLPGNGTNPALTSTPLPDYAAAVPEEAVPGLLMGNAERADVIVDFRGLLQGTRVRLINTGPDEPFGGFPGPAADPDTTGQVMEFMVVANTAVGDGATPPASLVLSPVEGVDTYPAGKPNTNPVPRDLALLEEESLLICVTMDAITGTIVHDPAAVPNPADPATCVLTGTTTLATSLPFGPKAAVLGTAGSGTPVVTLWSDPIRTNPQVDQAGEPPTETWEFWNHTVDAHPIHVHEVKFKVINRQAFDPANGAFTGPVRAPEATETGWKDTVIAYPSDVTRIVATFDLKGLYVWHCHIVEHEDNEMMVPYCIGNKDPALGPVAPGCALQPPVAVDDSYTTNEDTTLTVPAPGVLANDTDINAANTLTAKLVSGPAHGNLTLNADGSFSYTPNADYNGPDAFTYKANDGSADSPTAATVTITVNPVNDPPVAVNDAYATSEDTPLTVAAPGLLANDTDVDVGTILTAVLVSAPANGKVTLKRNGSFTYTPNLNFNGADTFTYKAKDGVANSNVATVTVTVNPVNDAPVAVNDAYTTNEDTALTVAVPGVLGNDKDVDGTSLTAALVTGPANGTLALNPNGSFTYTPKLNFNGADTFTYKANDGVANSNVATVTITINPVNDAPAAVNDAYTTSENTALTVAARGVLANDTDVDVGTTLAAALVSAPANGKVTLNPNGSFTYTPNLSFNGLDRFTYVAFDGALVSNQATVTITVTPAAKCMVIIDEEGVDNDFYSVGQAAPSCGVTPDELVNDNNWLGKFGYDPAKLFPTYAECQAINETNNGGKTLPTKCGNPPLLWNLRVGGGMCGIANGPGRLALMPTGQRDDEGWFALPPKVPGQGIRYADTRPSSCDKYRNGDAGYDLWVSDFSKGLVRQECLDKVKDVMPLRNQDLIQLVGKTCVAIVYDSEISINYKPLYANLQGERYGKFTFKVEAAEVAGSLPESKSSTSLYDLWLRILPPAEPTTPLKVKIHDHMPATAQTTNVAISTVNTTTKRLTVEATTTYAGTDNTPPYLGNPSSKVNDPNSVYNTPKLPTPRTDGDDKTYLTVSVDNRTDKGASGSPDTSAADAATDPYVREVQIPYISGATYRATIDYPSTVVLKGRRLSIQGDEGGIYNVIIP